MKIRPYLPMTALLLAVFVSLFLSVVGNYGLIFDDAFISYRYARNLADGNGLVWNVGEKPTEGFTNLLLVLVLVPFLKLDIDPLLVTRILSVGCATGISFTLWKELSGSQRKRFVVPLVTSAAYMLNVNTQALIFVGLETLIYSLFLMLAFIYGARMLNAPTTSNLWGFTTACILGVLLRPEIIILIVAFVIATFVYRKRYCKTTTKLFIVFLCSLMAFFLVYLAWKYVYFGDFLPNPYYIKAAKRGVFQKSGLISVYGFLKLYMPLVLLSFISIGHFKLAKVQVGDFFYVAYFILVCGFFVRTDTLMDISDRFMHPLLPIVLYVASKQLLVVECKLKAYHRGDIRYLLLTLALVFACVPNVIDSNAANARSFLTGTNPHDPEGLMHKEFVIAKRLAGFKNIRKVTVAFGDAGVIPYVTRSHWLDTVGLNDSFIARHKNLDHLVDYFFSRKPDLVLHPGGHDFEWISFGHGTLGNYPMWSSDVRWDDYEYVGTCRTNGSYDLHFLVNKQSVHYKELSAFLESSVIDGTYQPFPLRLGSYRPASSTAKYLPQSQIRVSE